MKHNIESLMTTSQVSQVLNVSTDTVRRWHKLKKLIPSYIDKRGAKNTRYYTIDQIHKFKKNLSKGL